MSKRNHKHHCHRPSSKKNGGTPFSEVYNRFLGKITDDMYLELTPEDTIRDLQHLLIDAIPGFEFPRKNLFDYTISTKIINQQDLQAGDFVMCVLWDDLDQKEENSEGSSSGSEMLIESSRFNVKLTSEEINILALLMKSAWVQRQVTSIENTRMKYSGADFKMTSQANHLSKLLSLLSESQRESFHMQRLYRRRRLNHKGEYRSNWRVLRRRSALD